MHDDPERDSRESAELPPSWYDERIEPYLDADLPEDERVVFVERMRQDTALRDQVALAEQVSLSLAAAQSPVCSEDLVRRLERIAVQVDVVSGRRLVEQSDRAASRSRLRLVSTTSLRWPVGIAAAAVLSLVLFRGIALHDGGATLPVNDQAPAQAYSDAEVAEALREAKFALALVSNAGRQAGSTVRETVIRRNVVEPVNEAFETTVFGPQGRTN